MPTGLVGLRDSGGYSLKVARNLSDLDSSAIAWSVIAEVFARHPEAEKLRVIEIFANLGRWHLMRIIKIGDRDRRIYGGESRRMCDLDLQTGALLRSYSENLQLANWLKDWNAEQGISSDLEWGFNEIGLPLQKRTNSGRRAATCALMAKMLNSEGRYRARMAWRHTSGGGGGLNPILSDYPNMFSADDDPVSQGSKAADCWILYAGARRRMIGIIRMDGMLSAAQEPRTAVDLYDTSGADTLTRLAAGS